MKRIGAISFSLLIGALAPCFSQLAQSAAAAPVVSTVEGPVRGISKDGVNVFLGIPYAAPPVGKLRWQPPQAVAKWRAPLKADKFGSACPQVTTLGVYTSQSIDEDCLFLNVYTTGPERNGEKQPVIVWIHGGGNVAGAGSEYDGGKLAKGGPYGTPTVVVTINYRLGMLGTISETNLNSEGHLAGNYALMDQQAALRWVQRNIAAFGGDPTRVALGGQSAGAGDTAMHMLSPLSKGLFNRAILQSIPVGNWYVTDAQAALKSGNDFAAAAGCSSAACLRELSTARILQLQGTAAANSPYVQAVVWDGTLIDRMPADAWKSGAYNRMPVMGGSVRDESTFILAINQYFSGVAVTPEQYLTGKSAEVLARYPLSAFDGDPTLAQSRATVDSIFKCKSYDVLTTLAGSNGEHPVYAYDFTYDGAPFYFPKMLNPHSPTGSFRALAGHTIDIQFLFAGYHGGPLGVNIDQKTGQPRELQGEELVLSDRLIGAWTNFAKTGNPNSSDDVLWPALNNTSPKILNQDLRLSTITEQDYKARYHCDFWASQS